MGKYAAIQNLLEHFAAFEAEMQSDDLQEFACWLAQKTSVPKLVGGFHLPEASQDRGYVPHTHQLEAQISFMMGKMMRFAKIYSKKALEGLSIQSVEEFGCLAGIFELGNPSKSEISNMMLTEMTTAVEMIRRLVNNGLVAEAPDPHDKRTKRLSLTPAGQGVLFQAFQAMEQVGRAGFSFLEWEEKIQLYAVLSKLSRKHHQLYLAHKEEELEVLIGKLEGEL